jgi:acyl-CoA dehydrogenase
MSENRALLCDTANRVFGTATRWSDIADAGFGALLLPEEQGGFGGDWGDLCAVMHIAGMKALAFPVGETIIAAWLLHVCGLDVPEGPLGLMGDDGAVPWGRDVVASVQAKGGRLQMFAPDFGQSHSPAGEPRDHLISEKIVHERPCAASTQSLGAFLRATQSAGALDAALAMSIEHANMRVQFGKPLSKFQAVQQNLATLAVEAAAVNVAGAAAAVALDQGRSAQFEIAAAKLRTNAAIGLGTAIAHQVHGAIGFTQAYPLHHLTRRLMGWRSEYGNDAYWAARLGTIAVDLGGAGLWAEISRRS